MRASGRITLRVAQASENTGNLLCRENLSLKAPDMPGKGPGQRDAESAGMAYSHDFGSRFWHQSGMRKIL